MNKKQDPNKEFAELFFNLYAGCIKFQSQISNKNKKDRIDCSEYYKKFEFYSSEYIDNKESKN